MDRTLTETGHHSIVIAAEGSRVRGTHIQSPAAPDFLDDAVRADDARAHRVLLAKTLARSPVDLVHFDTRELARALHSMDLLDRAACRKRAETEFCANRMARRYLELYDHLIHQCAA